MNFSEFIKIVHLFAVFSWMSGIFYLPRIFVYHSVKELNIETNETFKIMEHKLFYYIMYPSMFLVWSSGLYLFIFFEFYKLPLFHLKILSVLILSFYHLYLGWIIKKFKFNKNVKNSKYYRIINEIPAVLLIIIIYVIVIKSY